MLFSKLHKLMKRKSKNGEPDDLISAVVGYFPLEPMGIHRDCTFARFLSPNSSIFKNSDMIAAHATQPRQTYANLMAPCKCSYWAEEVHDDHRAFDRESRDAEVAATGSDAALLRDPPHTDPERRARGHRTLQIKQVSSAFQQSRYVASDIRNETERTNGEPARYASIYTRYPPHLLVAIFADVSGDDPSVTIDPQTPRTVGYPLMPPLAEGDAAQGHLLDTALMNLLEHNGAEATIQLTSDPNYRLDPPMADRAVGRFSADALLNPSVGAMGHDLRLFFDSIEGADTDAEIDSLRTQLADLGRDYKARAGGRTPLIFQVIEKIMPRTLNPSYPEE